MNAYDNPLEHVKVAEPCPANWDNMCGNEQVRFCGQCNLSVYNLSGMTRHEAEAFVTRAEGRVCVRFFRRADGTILTENLPRRFARFEEACDRHRKGCGLDGDGFCRGTQLQHRFFWERV